MKKLKEIEKYLETTVDYNCCCRSDNGQILCVKCCAIGDNFYDYGDEPRNELKYDSPIMKEIANDPRVYIIMCEECCGCAGW